MSAIEVVFSAIDFAKSSVASMNAPLAETNQRIRGTLPAKQPLSHNALKLYNSA